ncbi:MAG: F0F1 ATP synthase subunit A [Myxococcota bacterium]
MSHPLNVFDLIEPFVPITLSSLLTCLLITVILAGLVRRGLRETDGVVPEGRLTVRNILELMLEGMVSLARETIGPEWPRWMPLIGTMGFFILVSNLMGLIPGFTNPTSFVETNVAWALVSFGTFVYAGFSTHGVSYVRHFVGPVWWLAWLVFPLEIVSAVIRIMSLTIRLTANMFADHTLIAVFLSFPVVQFFAPSLFMGLGLFVALLQAFIFSFLTMIYIGEAVHEAH